MNFQKIVAALIFLQIAFHSNLVVAQITINLQAVADATVSEFTGVDRLGEEPLLKVQPWTGYSSRFLIKFDLSSIPTDAQIMSAELKLSVFPYGSITRQINVHSVTASWVEEDVNWNDFANQYNNQPTNEHVMNTGDNSTSIDLTADVQSMVDGILVNNGWIIKDYLEDNNPGALWFFYSSDDNANNDLVPTLEVTYVAGVVESEITVNSIIGNNSCTGANDGSVEIEVSGGTGSGYDYIWSPQPGTGQGTNIISGLAVGSWTVEITDQGNRDFTKEVTFNVTEPTPILISGGPQKASCEQCQDGEFLMFAIGGVSPYQYSIDGGTSFSFENNFNGLPSGDYVIQAKDNNGCLSDLTPITLGFQPLQLSAVEIVASKCNLPTGSVNLSVAGGNPPYNFSWSNGSQEKDLIDVNSGFYSVQISDASANTISITYEVEKQLVWNDLVNIDFLDGSRLVKTSNNNWDGFAYSTSRLESNQNGFISMQVESDVESLMFGFTTSTDRLVHGNEYLIARYGSVLQIRVKDEDRLSETAVPFPGEGELKIERVGQRMFFLHDGVIIHVEGVDQSQSLSSVLKLYYIDDEVNTLAIDYCNDESFTNKEYYPLSSKIIGKTWNFTGPDLNFIYSNIYAVKGSNDILDIKVVDENNEIVASKNDFNQTVKHGFNSISIKCFSDFISGTSITNIYKVIVTNPKGEEMYIQLKVPNNLLNCN